MSASRTTQCLLTLSTKPEIACLVRVFSLRLSSSRILHESPNILAHALGNMTNLISLSLHLAVFATSAILSQATFRLTKLVCIMTSDEAYSISTFLSTQPDIEELYIVGQPNGLTDLDIDALPALRDLAAPLRLIPSLIRSSGSKISHLSILGTIAEFEEFVQLGTILEAIQAPGRVELVMSVDITAFLMTTDILAKGLSLLGQRAPFTISLLRLELHRGHIRQDDLRDVLKSALPEFPNLKTLVIMSHSPVRGAYIRTPTQALSYSPPICSIPIGALSTLAPLHPSSRLEYDEARGWISLIPGVLHDKSCHKKLLGTWHRVHPVLERVVFPIGTYTFVHKKR
ncbi:hypothetical protein RhiXN_01114 [Rhizoctonia solani]|nr:uncharacterized protein RhiXN_01114 [Rhizoctonia solani]QRW19708.1 hypothetical protein RhiXN_01114 [Rhizoctonia solani]